MNQKTASPILCNLLHFNPSSEAVVVVVVVRLMMMFQMPGVTIFSLVTSLSALGHQRKFIPQLGK